MGVANHRVDLVVDVICSLVQQLDRGPVSNSGTIHDEITNIHTSVGLWEIATGDPGFRRVACRGCSIQDWAWQIAECLIEGDQVDLFIRELLALLERQHSSRMSQMVRAHRGLAALGISIPEPDTLAYRVLQFGDSVDRPTMLALRQVVFGNRALQPSPGQIDQSVESD